MLRLTPILATLHQKRCPNARRFPPEGTRQPGDEAPPSARLALTGVLCYNEDINICSIRSESRDLCLPAAELLTMLLSARPPLSVWCRGRVHPREEPTLLVRLEAARQVYNACLGEARKRVRLVHESKAFQRARTISTTVCEVFKKNMPA